MNKFLSLLQKILPDAPAPPPERNYALVKNKDGKVVDSVEVVWIDGEEYLQFWTEGTMKGYCPKVKSVKS